MKLWPMVSREKFEALKRTLLRTEHLCASATVAAVDYACELEKRSQYAMVFNDLAPERESR